MIRDGRIADAKTALGGIELDFQRLKEEVPLEG
jgi:hypothetical protein